MSHEKVTIGLALGGGAARGIAHIGVLQALENAGIPIDYIAGTSVGALVGAIYASGVSAQEMQKVALNIKWRDLFSPHLTRKSVASGKRFVTFLQKHCRCDRFEDLQIPLSVVVSDFETGDGMTIAEGELFPAIQASCSIPLVFPPVKLNERYYIDGGLASVIPVEAMKQMGADVVIACDVNYYTNLKDKPGNFVTMGIQLIKLFLKAISKDAKNQADISININMNRLGLMSLHKGSELIQRGFQATEAVLPELQELLLKK
jgi:NTE family protein